MCDEQRVRGPQRGAPHGRIEYPIESIGAGVGVPSRKPAIRPPERIECTEVALRLKDVRWRVRRERFAVCDRPARGVADDLQELARLDRSLQVFGRIRTARRAVDQRVTSVFAAVARRNRYSSHNKYVTHDGRGASKLHARIRLLHNGLRWSHPRKSSTATSCIGCSKATGLRPPRPASA